ncbi:MAG: TolC family protein [Vicinamibacterales bacterium]
MTRTAIVVLAAVVTAAAHRPVWAQPATPIRLSVADAVSRGIETSHRLAEIRARQQGAQASVRVTRLSERPSVAASAGYTRTNHVPEFSLTQGGVTRVLYPDLPDNVLTRLSFQWPIYTAGRADALERAADAEAQAVGSDLEAARADLRLEIVRAYWAAVTGREAVRVLEVSMARVDAQLRDARQRFEVGLVPPNEISSLAAQRSREEAQLIEARNIRESTVVDLRRLVGVDPEAVLDLIDTLASSSPNIAETGTVSDTVQRALAQRPERRALTLRLGGAEAREQAAAAARKPTIAFGGGVDYANPNPHIFPRQDKWQPSWDLSVNVAWTLFDFGRAQAQMSEAAALASAIRERMAELDSVVAADLRQRLLELDSSRAQVKAAAAAVASAADARRVVADRFTAGVATSTDVLVAQVALLETELARTRALAGVRLAEARLDRAIGRP